MRFSVWKYERLRVVNLRTLLRRNRLWLVAALCGIGVSLAYGQQGPPASIGPTDLQASTSLCATAPAVNATVATGTCTINIFANQHLYINYLQVGVCTDDTANAVNTPQLVFTSTNLNGWQQQFSWLQGGTAGTVGTFTPCLFMGGARSHPLVSAAGPAAITIVPPAQQAHSSYPINVEGYVGQ